MAETVTDAVPTVADLWIGPPGASLPSRLDQAGWQVIGSVELDPVPAKVCTTEPVTMQFDVKLDRGTLRLLIGPTLRSPSRYVRRHLPLARSERRALRARRRTLRRIRRMVARRG